MASPVPIGSRVPFDTPTASGPAEALADLLAGNRRFAAGRPRYGHGHTPAGRSPVQHPYALVLACLDSRVTPETVLDQDFGAIMVVRTGGHVLGDAVLGSVDFAVSVVGVPLLFVLGHQYCGGVAASVAARLDGIRPDGPLRYLVDQILPAVDDAAGDGPADRAALVDRASRRHVDRTVEKLSALRVVAERVSGGGLVVVGGFYEIDSGRVELCRRVRPAR